MCSNTSMSSAWIEPARFSELSQVGLAETHISDSGATQNLLGLGNISIIELACHDVARYKLCHRQGHYAGVAPDVQR